MAASERIHRGLDPLTVRLRVRYGSRRGRCNGAHLAPSQMLENYVWVEESLRRMSGHYLTGAPVPTAMLQNQLAARMAMAGLLTRRQVRLAGHLARRLAVPKPLHLPLQWADTLRRSRKPMWVGGHDF